MVTNTTAFQVGVGTMLQMNRNHVVSWHQGASGNVSLYLLCFSIHSIKTPVGRNELVKALGWSGFAHLSLFPVTQVICNPVC